MTFHAVIIPTESVNNTQVTGSITNDERAVHFILGQYLLSDALYYRYYEQLRKHEPGAIFIVDNGVAEGSETSFPDIVEKAAPLLPTYYVMPDALQNYPDTIAKTKEALWSVAPRNRILVPQAQTNDWAQWQLCANELFDLVGGDEGFGMWGIPKLLERWEGGRTVAMGILKDDGYLDNKEVHFLGFSDHPVKEIQAVYPHRRKIFSWDSGAAFAYAHKNKTITHVDRESLVWKSKPNITMFLRNVHTLDILMSEHIDLLGRLHGK